ncbi:MAG: ABC transporter substrate-binding protein [Nostocaceae cyanobacterium]|nr:ABC transporter substrate-binding protein [Nostocaceae cyanobacterium]
MCENCQQVIEQLNINIELFFQKLDTLANKKPLSELDKRIICQSLLGYSRKDLANTVNLSAQNIRDRLAYYIYPRIAELLQVDQQQIAGNWVRILCFLVDQKNGYKLNPPLQLNNDNFQGSFGRQIFLYRPHQEIVQSQIEGTTFYQKGLYYQALRCFLSAWKKELEIYGIGNPEILIYINNCLIEYKMPWLKSQKISSYTLAVVVPFFHNHGQVATEILRGIAQIQLQINWQISQDVSLENQINLDEIIPKRFFSINNVDIPICLQILIVNDPNNLYAPYNQTADNLANLASQLNVIAILGHYSSEMTKKALKHYSQKGLLLVNASSTSNEFSQLSVGESLSFFRLTTQDSVNARRLASYLTNNYCDKAQQKVAIIYNKNSSYSISYRNAIKEYLELHQQRFIFLKECSDLGENYYEIQKYIEKIRETGVDIIILIPDGGIEPNSLNNAGLISRLNLTNCLIAGSATFYQDNVLHWIHEQSQYNSINHSECQILASIPWHWESQENGCNSDNLLAQRFCEIGTQLWGKNNLTWRSATSFDSVLIILRVLERYRCNDGQSLLICMNQYFKEQRNKVRGVTGIIEFDEKGDRINPPAEIVTVKWCGENKKWQWTIC